MIPSLRGNDDESALGAPLARMAMQYGAEAYGSRIIHEGQSFLSRVINLPRIQFYFSVTNQYIMKKLVMVLFPFKHDYRRIVRSVDGIDKPVPPSEDANCPDLYLGLMSIISYLVVCGMGYVNRGQFDPSHLSFCLFSVIALLALEILAFKLAAARLHLQHGPIIEVLAVAQYKFIGLLAAMLASMVYRPLYYVVLAYSAMAFALFYMRCLIAGKIVHHPPEMALAQNAPLAGPVHARVLQRRNYMGFFLGLAQVGPMLLLGMMRPRVAVFPWVA